MKKTVINRFARYEVEETDGRNFICTDIHGQHQMLTEALKILGFVNYPDPKGTDKPDKLFCLGDMCDRGIGSFDVLQSFRYNPNYESLCGNHEKMAFRGTRTLPFKWLSNSTYQGHDRTFWIDNGGEWFKQHDFHAVRDICEWANELPYAAELIIGDVRIGMSHAEIATPSSMSGEKHEWFVNEEYHWDDTVKLASEEQSSNHYYEERREYVLTFNRKAANLELELDVKGIDVVLHGHTVETGLPPVRGNQIYIDGGAPFVGLTGESDCSLNILEFAPSEDSILGLFKLYQFYYNADGHLDIR